MTEKEKGAIPFESAPQGDTASIDSIAPGPERGIYNPLTWRADPIACKRGEIGRTTPEALAWLAITGLMMLAGWLWGAAR
ncbi:hypothetical protein CGK74_14435 [Thauera propionica]|uniref:Uncharacterized protein n=1 Tax=Thauera propionica TaxID=2019431 RepID=A0A235EVV0_9RHOO|nr:hypothetical protein [Thauera propionica]OYD53111.1 hypothetical protein CGK74_14435 [Thauera propionica]